MRKKRERERQAGERAASDGGVQVMGKGREGGGERDRDREREADRQRKAERQRHKER